MGLEGVALGLAVGLEGTKVGIRDGIALGPILGLEGATVGNCAESDTVGDILGVTACAPQSTEQINKAILDAERILEVVPMYNIKILAK